MCLITVDLKYYIKKRPNEIHGWGTFETEQIPKQKKINSVAAPNCGSTRTSKAVITFESEKKSETKPELWVGCDSAGKKIESAKP